MSVSPMWAYLVEYVEWIINLCFMTVALYFRLFTQLFYFGLVDVLFGRGENQGNEKKVRWWTKLKQWHIFHVRLYLDLLALKRQFLTLKTLSKKIKSLTILKTLLKIKPPHIEILLNSVL